MPASDEELGGDEKAGANELLGFRFALNASHNEDWQDEVLYILRCARFHRTTVLSVSMEESFAGVWSTSVDVSQIGGRPSIKGSHQARCESFGVSKAEEALIRIEAQSQSTFVSLPSILKRVMNKTLPSRRWEAKLSGELPDLEALAQTFRFPLCEVRKADDHFILCSTAMETQDPSDASNVLATATELLNLINGAATVLLPSYQQVQIAALSRNESDRPPTQFIFPSGIMAPRGTLTKRVSRADGTIEEITESINGEPLIRVALNDSNASAILSLIGKSSLDWRDLYVVFDTVRDDLGRAAMNTQWGRSRLDRFTATANSWNILGASSRHGAGGRTAPKRPMPFEEAESLIKEIALWWLNQKR